MSANYEPSQEQFDADVASGKLSVLKDHGLHRHLRFNIRTGGFSWFEIVTWPGKLVISGDCETFVFSRLDDMFEFFRDARINPGYWQEKILDGRDRARGFDWDRFRAEALANFDQETEGEQDTELRAAARDDLESALDSTEADKYGAVQMLRDYEYRPAFDQPPFFKFDLMESPPSGEGWDYHYIWCCRAILWAISQYDAHKASAQKEPIK